MSTRLSLALIVPAFNEADRLRSESFLEFLRANPDSRLVFVDDGSTDGTVAMLEQLSAELPGRVDIIALTTNSGKAEAVRRGLVHAAAGKYDTIGFLDADLSAPLDAALLLVRELEEHPGAWAAIGSRVRLLGRRVERSALRHYLGRVFATAASLTLGMPVYDTQCGCKLFRNTPEVASVFTEPFSSRWIFDVELLARLRSVPGASIESRFREVPLESWEADDASRLSLGDWLRAPRELWAIHRRYPVSK